MKMLTKRLSIQATNTMPWSQLGLREDVVDLQGENGQTCTGQAGGLHKMVSAQNKHVHAIVFPQASAGCNEHLKNMEA